jgi:hypothetical protein
VDSILGANSILDEKNWLFFKLYKNPNSPGDWKSNLDWYHQTLINVVKPAVLSKPQIRVVFFGFYGPTTYSAEGETYERQIQQRVQSMNNLTYIRIRFSVKRGHKRNITNTLLALINNNRNVIWDYEIMRTYHVRNDLGSRYGSNSNAQTLQFIRYWDAACRYILSILALPGNWAQDVDVWGIPHLVNNSLGAWLRPERPSQPCPTCQTHMYMVTCVCQISPSQQTNAIPYFLFACPNCSNELLRPCNI